MAEKRKIMVTIDEDILAWIEEQKKTKHRFASISHGLECCVAQVMAEEGGDNDGR